MKIFDAKALHQWTDWPAMTPLLFDVDTDYRVCRCSIVSDAPIRVYAVTQEDYQPIAVVEGMAEIQFTTAEGTSLAWFGPDRLNMDGKSKGAPLVRVLTLARSQMMDGDDQDSFTVIEPRGSVENEQMRRMQHLMFINMKQRLDAQQAAWEAQFADTIARAGADVQMPPDQGGDDGAAPVVE